MNIPITGLVLIPLGALLVFLPWRYFLMGLTTFAMMSPAAVVNAGSFGLEPGYFLALLGIARVFVSVMTHGFTLNRFVLGAMRPLFTFAALAFLVLFVALCFFQGQVETLPGTAGFKTGAVQHFQLGRNNFTQVAYLLINLLFVYCLAHQGARQRYETLLKDWDRAIICGLCFAVFVSVWQFVSLYAGLPFPGDFFYSNAGYSRADSQTMLGLFRINGPFEEPSTLGYTFTGYLLFSWARYRLHPTALSGLMIAGCIFCMLVSTSTTAFIGLLLFVCLAVFDVATGRVSMFPRTLSAGQMVVLAALFIGVLIGSIVVAANWQAISLILDNVIFNKTESTSFQQRSYADFLAIKAFVETYGIGVGLGSHKANSLLLTLLSNVGIAGVILFGAFVYALLRSLFVRIDASRDMFQRGLAPFQWALVGLIVVHIGSNPNLSTLTLWLQMGGLLALQASLHRAVPLARPGLAAFGVIALPRRVISDGRDAGSTSAGRTIA